ncbi:MAG: nitronate monooxygenase [Rikenellaceae bacterium]|nr:nitronate monooxygenase [Rikenellaceae bacterium]MDE7134379.1 nitronate monooxygenase [Rikenellaceae bacterium]MDE7356193.1 nitronate monooxygenase [Rikenellaceae bacterium]
MKTSRITDLFGIEKPIVAGGMVWCSGHRLASAVSNCGGLGLIGSGSMHPDTLREHIEKCKSETDKPFGVNLSLFYPQLEEAVQIILSSGVKIVFTSAGNPAMLTGRLKEAGITVVHVVSSAKFALKAQAAGVDAVVAEGFEAGGHNGRDETATMVLTPSVCQAVEVPVIAAGGISTGAQVAAAFALGAEGVQIGTRFALCDESSASEAFKQRCRGLAEGGTMLTLKRSGNVRMVKNEFYARVAEAIERGATDDEIKEIVGQRRAKLGIFEGDMQEGMLEIGQTATLVERKESVADIFADIEAGYAAAASRLQL